MTVAQLSTLSFELSLSTLIPSGGYIMLQFSTGFDLTKSTNLSCTQVYGMQFFSGCTAQGASTLKLNNAGSQDYLIMWTVNSVLLPNYVNSFFVVATSYQSSGTVIETSGTTALKMTTSAQSLAVTLTPASMTVADYTNLQINTVTTLTVPSTGQLEIDFPKWNAGTQTLGLETSYFNLQQLNFDGVTNTYVLPCTSTLNPSLICSLTVGNANTVQEIATTFDSVKIRSFNQDFTSLSVTINLNVFRNPPSTRAITNIDATQFNSAGFLQQQQTVIKLQVTQAASMPVSNAQVSTLLGSINAQDTYTFTFDMTLPLPVGAVIQIKIPPQVKLVSSTDSNSIILNSANGYDPIYMVPQVKITNQSTQTIIVTNVVPTSNYYVDAGNFIKFDLIYLTNPASIKTTDPFNITFYDEDNIIMTVQPGPTLTATPGKFQSLYVEPENYRVRQETPYKFGFVTLNGIGVDSKVLITVPVQIGVIPGNLYVEGVTTMSPNTNITVSYNSVTNQILISNCYTQSYLYPQLVEFIITSGITNADDTQPCSPFIVSTTDKDGGMIDSGYSEQLTFSANTIQEIITTACADKQTASVTEDVCTYRLQFMIGAQWPILAGSYIQITLPDDLELYDSTRTAKNSTTQGVSDLSSTFAVQSDLKTIIVSNAFQLSSAPNGIDYRQDSFAVNIAGIVSPRSTAPTLSFVAKIYSSDDYLQYDKLQGVYSNVYEARMFTKAVIKRNNEVNGESGTYNFTLQFSSRVFKNEYIKLTPPETISITVGIDNQCVGLRLLSPSLTCTIIDGSLYVLIMPANATTEYFEPGTIVQFQVNNISNPLSLEPTLSYSIYVATDTIQNFYVNQMIQGLSLLNVFNGQLLNVQVIPDSSQFGQQTDYSIYFTTANIIPARGYIEIIFPQGYYTIYQNVTCSPIKNVYQYATCSLVDTNTILLSNAFIYSLTPGQEVGFKIRNIINPNESVNATVISQDFFITTYTPFDYSIDQTSNLNFTIGCNFPCNSCDQDQSVCTSCQKVNGIQLLLYQSSCSAQCPVGYFADSNYICQTCNYPCAQCNKQKDFCDSCLTTSGLPYAALNGQCYKDCPQGSFANPSTLTCDPCVNSCATCLNQGECLSCTNNTYFTDGQCVVSCPDTSIKFDSVEVLECLDCKSPCVTCNTTIDTCTSCVVGTYLYQSACVDKCPTTWLPDALNVCYLASQFTLPFIMMLGTLIIGIVVTASHIKYRAETKPLSAYLGLQISWMVLFWMWCFGWYVSDSYRASATVTGLAIVANYIINYWWFEYYKARIMQNDKLYRAYKDANPHCQKAIVVLSLMTSFQLFRLSYSRLFDCAGMNAQLENREKYFKKMNRLTHFQLTFVFLPTVIAAIYNLFYTWYGRQCFWNDIENLVQCAQTMTLMVLVLFRSQIHYIGLITKEDELAAGEKHENKIETHQVQTIADHIAEDGFEKQKDALKDLTPETRMDVITGLFNRLVRGKQLHNKKVVGGTETPYVTTHGQKTQKFNTAFQAQKKELNLNAKLGKFDKVPETNITGVLNSDMNMTEINHFEDTQKMPLKVADYLGNDQEANGPGQRQKGKQQFLEGDEDLFNFQSAPLNARSALKGNVALQERYTGLLNQLDAVRKKKLASKAIVGRGRSKTSQAAHSKDSENENLSFEAKEGDYNDQITERMKQYILPEDSDDLAEKFTSEKYGEGTSKVVAHHYNTIQTKSGIQKDLKSRFKDANKSTAPDKLGKLNPADMQAIVDQIKKAQTQKEKAKLRVDDFEGQKDVIAVNVAKTKAKNSEVQGMIKDLEAEIAAEIMRLEKVRHLKDQDVQFVENAFYTSNEDGMGVSPSAYTNQNAIPRPATKMREPPRIPPFGEQNIDQIIQEDQILRDVERSESRKRTKSSYQDGNMVVLDPARGKSGHSGRAETLESARKKSNQESNKDSLPDIKKIISSASTKMRKKKGPRSNNSNHAANLQISDNSSSQIELKGRNRKQSKLDVSSRSKSKQGKKTADFGAMGSSDNKSQGNARNKGVLLTSSSNQLEGVRSPNESKHRRPGTKSKGEISPHLSKISEGSLPAARRNKMSETARSGQNLSNDRSRLALGVINETGKEKSTGLRRGSMIAKHLKMKPISKERDGLEYVTSEDSQGRPIKKLKKMQKAKGIRAESLSSHRHDSQEDSMEYYTSEDKKGNKVQKLRRKEKKSGLSSIQERGRKKIKSVKRSSDMSEPKNGRSLGARVIATQPFDFSRAPQRSTENSLEDQQAIALNNRAKKKSGLPVTKSQDRLRAGTNPAKQDTNYKLNQLAGITTSTFNDGNSILRGQSTLQDAGLMQTIKSRQQPTLAHQPPPDYAMTTLSDQKKPKKKKKSQPPVPQRDFGGVYFNHTQFERAVIATNGRAPYNNQEVEKLSKHRIESMTKDSFKNNWINQLILKEQAATSKSPREVIGSPRSQFRDHRSQFSASQTARTVFQGRPETMIDQNNILFGSVQQTEIKPTAPRKKTSPVPVRNPRLQTEVKEEQFLVSSNIADDDDALPIYKGKNPSRK